MPIPVWYAVDAAGNPDWAQIIVPTAAQLPLDPQADVPEGQMKVGRRLAVKLLNVARFVLGMLPEGFTGGEITEPVDVAMTDALHQVSLRAEAAFERNDYRGALVEIESFFWHWCDDYVELVKSRAYGDSQTAASAHAALAQGLSILQRLLVPFVAEESWSWTHDRSVHREPWPGSNADAESITLHDGDPGPDTFEFAADVLHQIRRAKTSKHVGMRTPVVQLTVVGTADQLALFRAGSPDLCAAGSVEKVTEVQSGATKGSASRSSSATRHRRLRPDRNA